MPHLRDLPDLLQELSERRLLRQPDDNLERQTLREQLGPRFLDFTSNDYLGLAAAHVSRGTPSSAAGAGASRLLYGSRAEHVTLERDLAQWTGFESALLFSSGYAANLGALSSLLGPEDVVVSDALNHASLIDGCRLSRATVRIVPHRKLEAFEETLRASGSARSRWVVVESYYSMDGDSPDLPALRTLCEHLDAHLYVDEAHALGVFGPRGAGLCAAQKVRPDVLMAGLGKACGVQGAFVASSTAVRTWLWNRARSFVFSTAPSPALTSLARQQIHRVQAADGARTHLEQGARELRARLLAQGIPLIPESHGPIIAVPLETPETTLAVAAALRRRGLLAQAIRPPTVPSPRLRLTVTAEHRLEDLERVAREVGDVFNLLVPKAPPIRRDEALELPENRSAPGQHPPGRE